MSYYDHAVMMALRLGPWASRAPTQIDAEIEVAARLQRRGEPSRKAGQGIGRRLLAALARRWGFGWPHRSLPGPQSGPCPGQGADRIGRAQAEGDAPGKT